MIVWVIIVVILVVFVDDVVVVFVLVVFVGDIVVVIVVGIVDVDVIVVDGVVCLVGGGIIKLLLGFRNGIGFCL